MEILEIFGWLWRGIFLVLVVFAPWIVLMTLEYYFESRNDNV